MKNVHSWNWLVAVCVVCLGLAASAKSDTYNFYFTNAKKKSAAVDNQPADDSDDDEAPAAPPMAVRNTPPAATHQNQVAVTPNGQQPIIINNNNNISVPSMAAASPPSVAPAPPPAANETATVATRALVDDYHYPFHFGLSTAFYTGRRAWLTYGKDTEYESVHYGQQGSQWAGLINLGVDFTPILGLNAYASTVVAGHSEGNTFDAGGDLELTPFHISGSKYDIVRLGMLAGTSSAIWGDAVPVHVGGRITINLDRQFGVTGAVRTNFHMAMAEAGIITHF